MGRIRYREFYQSIGYIDFHVTADSTATPIVERAELKLFIAKGATTTPACLKYTPPANTCVTLHDDASDVEKGWGMTILQAAAKVAKEKLVELTFSVLRAPQQHGERVGVRMTMKFSSHLWFIKRFSWRRSAAAALLFSRLRPMPSPSDAHADADGADGAVQTTAPAVQGGTDDAADHHDDDACYTLESCFKALPDCSELDAAPLPDAPPPLHAAASTLHSYARLVDMPVDVVRAVMKQLSNRDVLSLSCTCRLLAEMGREVVNDIKLDLYPHQRVAVRWMMRREQKRGCVPHPYIRSMHCEGVTLHLDTATGDISVDAPPAVTEVRGGFFCDEPGLGKTITALALILRTRGQLAEAPVNSNVTWLRTLAGCQKRGYYMRDAVDASVAASDDVAEDAANSSAATPSSPHNGQRQRAQRRASASPLACRRWTPRLDTSVLGYCRSEEQCGAVQNAEYFLQILQQFDHDEPGRDFFSRHSPFMQLVSKDAKSLQRNGVSIPQRSIAQWGISSKTLARLLTTAFHLELDEDGSKTQPWRQADEAEDLFFDVPALRHSLQSWKQECSKRVYLSCATLIVVPQILIDHWQHQIATHVRAGSLRVHVLSSSKDLMDAAELASSFDVVLTTFSRLSSEWSNNGAASSLMQVHWLRIILDEGHMLGTSLGITNKLRMAVELRAERRWVMTGTPTPNTPSSNLAHLQPLLNFLHHRPFGSSCKAWQDAIQKPFDSKFPEGCVRLMDLLSRCMLRASKEHVRGIPPCHIHIEKLQFEHDHARSYNELVEVVRRNLLLADFYDEDHVESLMSSVNTRYAGEMQTNARLSCCVAGNCTLSVKESDLIETLELLAARLGIDMPPQYQPSPAPTAGEPPSQDAVMQPPPAETSAAVEPQQEPDLLQKVLEAVAVDSQAVPHQRESQQHSVDVQQSSDQPLSEHTPLPQLPPAICPTPLQAAEQPPPHNGTQAPQPLSQQPPPQQHQLAQHAEQQDMGAVLPRGHALRYVEDALRDGSSCCMCGQYSRMPLVTPCAHLFCVQCLSTCRTHCPLCKTAYVMQAVNDEDRIKVNRYPKWDVPIEVIEWQPSYAQKGAVGISGGEWQPHWQVTKSSKCEYLVKRLHEIGAVRAADAGTDHSTHNMQLAHDRSIDHQPSTSSLRVPVRRSRVTFEDAGTSDDVAGPSSSTAVPRRRRVAFDDVTTADCTHPKADSQQDPADHAAAVVAVMTSTQDHPVPHSPIPCSAAAVENSVQRQHRTKRVKFADMSDMDDDDQVPMSITCERASFSATTSSAACSSDGWLFDDTDMQTVAVTDIHSATSTGAQSIAMTETPTLEMTEAPVPTMNETHCVTEALGDASTDTQVGAAHAAQRDEHTAHECGHVRLQPLRPPSSCLRPAKPLTKTIVFSEFWIHISLIASTLAANGITFAVLKRDLPRLDKQHAVERFRCDGDCAVLLMDTTGAVGLDLSFASYVFLMEPLVDRSVEQQIVSRAHRMGAKQAIHVELLVMSNSIEELLLRCVHNGEAPAAALQDATTIDVPLPTANPLPHAAHSAEHSAEHAAHSVENAAHADHTDAMPIAASPSGQQGSLQDTPAATVTTPVDGTVTNSEMACTVQPQQGSTPAHESSCNAQGASGKRTTQGAKRRASTQGKSRSGGKRRRSSAIGSVAQQPSNSLVRLDCDKRSLRNLLLCSLQHVAV